MAGIVTLESTERELGTAGVQSAAGGSILGRVALAAAGAVSLQDLIEQVAALALEAVPAEHCAVFLADAGTTTLRSAWAVDRHAAGPGLRQGCRTLPLGDGDVDVATVPARLRLFRSGRVAAVADLARSSLAPPGLVDRAGTRAALLAPLVAHHEPVGLLVLGWSAPGRAFSQEERDTAAAIAAVMAMAVAGMRAGTEPVSAVSVRQLVAAGSSFEGATSVPEVLDRLDRALADVLEVQLVGVDVALDDDAADRAALAWRSAVARPARRADLALPITAADRQLGSVSLALPPRRLLHRDEVDACAALVSFAATALVRVVDEGRLRVRLQEAEARRRLSDVVASAGGVLPAIRELNRTLPGELGIAVEGLSVANAGLRASVGGEAPERVELEAIRSWRAVLARARSPLRPRRADGLVLVPVVHGNRVLGALRVAPAPVGGVASLADVADELLLAVGTGLAEVVHRAGLQREVAESERRLAVAAERERIAHDLHDSVGQIITGMGMRLAQCLADAPDRTWRARLEELLRMAGRGNREIRQAIHELLFLDARRDGLVASVRELVRTFEVTTGLPVHFVVKGTPASLAADREDALFRAAHEALVNVERHARASMATVELAYGTDAVTLVVRDDGVGLGHRDPFGADGGHFGIRAMQQRLESAGGELRVENARPRGVVVEAEIARVRRPARGTGTGTRRRRR